MGRLIRCITSDGLVSISAIDSTDIVSRAEQIHKTSAVVTAALGRLLTAASLMGSQLKSSDNSLTVRIACDGEIGGITTASDFNGNVRGYVNNPVVELPLNDIGKLYVGKVVGSGTLYVTKDLGLKEPYNGAVALASGEIAEDIATYYAVSEQIPTVCALGVLINPDLTVKAAGGYIIQLLPAAYDYEQAISKIEKSISGLPSVTQMLSNGMNIDEIAKKSLNQFEVEILDESVAEYKCNCSRERTEKVLITLGKEELNKLAEEQSETEVRCHFCEKRYKFCKSELLELIKNMK